MKRKLYTFLSLFFLSFPLVGFAQPLYLHWSKFFGTAGDDRVADAILTSDSSVVFVGLTADTTGLYDFPLTPPDSSFPWVNLVVGKIDTGKQLTWTKVYRGSRRESGQSIKQLSDGGFIILGSTESHDGDITFNHGQTDLWLLRLDSLGNLVWQKTYGSSLHEEPISVIQTSDNGFLFLGVSNGSDGDVPVHYGGLFGFDLLLIKTDPAGSIQWTKVVGGTGEEGFAGDLLEINNSYFLVSSSTSYDHDCNDTSWRSGPHSDRDFYMFRLDTSGSILWSKSYGGSDEDYAVNVTWDDRDSSIIINGHSESDDYMVQNWNTGNDYSIWLVKTDINGNVLWGSTLGDTSTDSYSSGILPSENGGYILSSQCYAGWPVKPGRVGSYDTRIFLLDSSGSCFYDKVFGGIYSEPGSRVLLPHKDGYTVLGESLSGQFTEGSNLNSNHDISGTADICWSALLTYPDPLSVSSKKANQSHLQVFPNPAKDIVKVVLPDTEGTLAVFDGSGKAVYNKFYKGRSEVTINTAVWPAGVYIVRWTNNNGERYSTKLIHN